MKIIRYKMKSLQYKMTILPLKNGDFWGDQGKRNVMSMNRGLKV